MKINPVKKALREGKPQVGTWLSLGSIVAARFLARTGLPWLTVEDNVALHFRFRGGRKAARPMVATEVDGTPEVVMHERTGLLVPPANPLALAAAIERLLDNPKLASRLATDGRNFVHENFAVQRQIEQTAAVYSELTGLGREGEAA